MKTVTLTKIVLLFGIILLSWQTSVAKLTHASIDVKNAALADNDNRNQVIDPTLDYKAVLINGKLWGWMRLNGGYEFGDEGFGANLLMCNSTGGETEEVWLKRYAVNGIFSEATGGSATQMAGWANPGPPLVTTRGYIGAFVVAGGGWAWTHRFPVFDSFSLNSKDNNDTEAPIMLGASKARSTYNTITLSLDGDDNSGSFFYHIKGDGAEEVAFSSPFTMNNLTPAKIYNLTITPIDFSGNEGTPTTIQVSTVDAPIASIKGTIAAVEDAGVRLDYKMVTIGAKVFSWVKRLDGKTFGYDSYSPNLCFFESSASEYFTQQVFMMKYDNNRAEAWISSSTDQDGYVMKPTNWFSYWVDWAPTGQPDKLETSKINYDLTKHNSAVTGDNTAPIIAASAVKSKTVRSVTLTLGTSSVTDDFFYLIEDKANNVQEVSFVSEYTIDGLPENTTFTLTITPIDFSGNKGTEQTVSATTDAIPDVLGSMKGSAELIIQPSGEEVAFDYKIASYAKTTKTWAWLKLKGGKSFNSTDGWNPHLRYYATSSATETRELWLARAANNTDAWGGGTTTNGGISGQLVIGEYISFWVNGGESTRMAYDTYAANSASGDTENPVLGACNVNMSGKLAMFTLNGTDNSGDFFYLIEDKVNDVMEVSFVNNFEIKELVSGKGYSFKITPIDFSGNEGTPVVVIANGGSGLKTNTISPLVVGYDSSTKAAIISGVEVASVKVYSLQGQAVRTALNTQEVDLSSVTNGIYVLKAMDNAGNMYTGKIIVK